MADEIFDFAVVRALRSAGHDVVADADRGQGHGRLWQRVLRRYQGLTVKKIRWTRHALDGLAEREINREEVEKAVNEPTAMAAGHMNRTVRLRRFHDQLLGQEMLLCVVTEDQGDEVVIVTAYKTSRFDKYLQGDMS